MCFLIVVAQVAGRIALCGSRGVRSGVRLRIGLWQYWLASSEDRYVVLNDEMPKIQDI